MGIGSSGVVNCANTYLGTANYTVADGYVADRTPIVGGDGPAQLNLNFARDEVLDPRITFSRTSNATRVNAQGLIEYAPHNLLTYSEQFDNAAWGKANVTFTANAVIAPDGTLSAELVEKLAVNGTFSQGVTSTAGGIYFGSVYVKAGTLNTASIALVNSNSSTVIGRGYINLITGEITNTTGTGILPAVNAGNGWWRVSIQGTAIDANTRLYIYPGIFSSSITGSIYVWGAQLNIGSLQPYYTTSVKNLLGYSQNFENAAWTKSNSSILYNLLTYSQEFDNAVWAKSNATVTANAVVAPDGTLTADKLEATTTTTTSVFQSITIAASSYTGSVYVKIGSGASDANRFYLRDSTAGTTLLQIAINYDTLAITYIVGSTGASVESVGNGWLRLSLTVTSDLTNGNTLRYGVCFVGNNETAGEFAYAWGAQLVQSTSPEEYTVTTSAAAPIQVMGPLGFVGAEKLVEDTVNAPHYIRQFPAITTPVAFSVYAKAGERTKVQLDCYDATNGTRNALFNLSTGTAEAITGAGVTSSIQSVGNGWYRCCMILPTSATGGDCKIALYTTSNSYTGDGTSGIYIFGAQLSDSASLDPYVYNFGAAPTSSAYYGPRFDYDPVTLAPKGLLIEEARTNYIRNNTMQGAVAGSPGTLPNNWSSSNFASYGLSSSIIGTGVDSGISYIDINVAGTPNSNGFLDILFETINISASNGQSWTESYYFKLINGSVNGLVNTGFRTGCYIYDSSSVYLGNLTGSYATPTSIFARPNTAFTITNASTGFIRPYLTFQVTNGTAINFTLRIGLPQLEQGAFATSVIPTTSAQVTRTADNASMVGTNFSSWYNQSEGTIYSEWILGNDIISSQIYNINDGASSNYIRNRYNSTGTAGDNAVVVSDVAQAILESTNQITTNSTYKNAMAYKQNDFARSSSGTLITDNLGNLPTVNQLNLGAAALSSGYLNGHIKTFKFFSKRFINTYLQSLTQ